MEHVTATESDLVDVNDLSLDQLAELPDTVLRAALRRVLVGRDVESQQFAMHQVSF